MTCDCDYAPLTFYCPLCRRDVCWCQGSYTYDGLEDLCDDCWCKVTHEWRPERVELLRRELAYRESGKAADAAAIDEILVQPNDLQWVADEGIQWFLFEEPIDSLMVPEWLGTVELLPNGLVRWWSYKHEDDGDGHDGEGTLVDCASALVEVVTR